MSLDDVRWIDLQDVSDSRGRLTAIEQGTHVPFSIVRVFYIHQVVPGIDRGGHAHIETDQLAVAVHGALKIEVGDGIRSVIFDLQDPARGLYIPRLLFTRLFDFTPGAVCLVCANTIYDQSKSLRSWRDYLDYRGLPQSGKGAD